MAHQKKKPRLVTLAATLAFAGGLIACQAEEFGGSDVERDTQALSLSGVQSASVAQGPAAIRFPVVGSAAVATTAAWAAPAAASTTPAGGASIGGLSAALNGGSGSAAAAAKYCWKPTHVRGVGTVPTICGPGAEYISGLCYDKCAPGYHSSWAAPTNCSADCPAGFRDDGLYCAKPGPYGRGGGYPWQLGDGFDLNGARQRCEHDNPIVGCEQLGLIYYPHCINGFHAVGTSICSPDCPVGMADIGVSCQKPWYDRGVGTLPTGCSPGEQYDAGLCYPDCNASEDGVGPVCWATCGGEHPFDCGAACATSQADCGSGIVGQALPIIKTVVDAVKENWPGVAADVISDYNAFNLPLCR